MAPNYLLHDLTPEMRRALPLIRAMTGAPSINAVILAGIQAMITTIRDNDPVIGAALRLSDEDAKLPTQLKLPAA